MGLVNLTPQRGHKFTTWTSGLVLETNISAYAARLQITDEQLRVARRGEFKGELAFRVRDTSNMTMHPVRRKAVRP